MEKRETTEGNKVSIRILQLKNNFYWDSGGTGRNALGKYCVLGYFDAMDITDAVKVEVTEFNTWKQLGELTSERDNRLSCRTLVCVTEQLDKDEKFWGDASRMFYFITMVRINKTASVEDKWREIEDKLPESENHINYMSYDHSEIIVATKTNTYSEGIKSVKKIRSVCEAVKTYTVFAVKESALESYETIQGRLTEEKVCCRLHCMVRDYAKAEAFRKKLEEHFTERNDRIIKIRKFETFGGYDWLLEIDDVSIRSVFECYKMGEVLTHSNQDYKEAFFNVESEILTEQEEDQDVEQLDRETEGTSGGEI